MKKFHALNRINLLTLLLFSSISKGQNLDASALNPDTFQPKLSQDLSAPSLNALREKISNWAQLNPGKIEVYKELGALTWSNPNLAEAARRVLSNLKQGLGTKSVNNNYKWADFIDLNQDQTLGVLDWLDLELFKSRLEIDRAWPLPELEHAQTPAKDISKLSPIFRKGKDLLPQVDASRMRFEQVLELLKSDPQNQQLKLEKTNLEKAFFSLIRQDELIRLQPALRLFEEIETLLAEAFDKDIQWRHRPSNFFRPRFSSLNPQTLLTASESLKSQLANWEILKVSYPTIDFPAAWTDKIKIAFIKTFEMEEALKKEFSSEAPSLSAFLSDLDKTLVKTNFVYTLSEPTQNWTRIFAFRLQNIQNSEILPSLVNTGTHKRASWFFPNQLDLQWIDDLSNFFDNFSAVNFSEKFNSFSRIAEFYTLKHSQLLAVQWIARVTKIGIDPNRPSFETIGNTLSWEMLKIPEVSSWAAEYAHTFVNSRLAKIQEIARNKNVNLIEIEKEIEKILVQKTALNIEKAETRKNGGLSDEQEAEFEQQEEDLATAVENLHSLRLGVLESPEVLAFSPGFLKQYQTRMNWPSYFDPNRMNQLEAMFGFDENAKNVFAVLRYLENQDDWIQADLNNDGEISKLDLETARLLLRSLVQKN